jgi:hypothetical protein
MVSAPGAADQRVVPRPAEQHVIPGQSAQNIALVGGCTDGRQPEDFAAKIDDIKIAARVFAKRRWIVHGADVGDDLRGSLRGNP